jgi:hypothetical protein
LTERDANRYIDSVISTDATDVALERARLLVVIATVAINVIAVSLLTFAPWSDWRTGTALNVIDNLADGLQKDPAASRTVSTTEADSLVAFMFLRSAAL